MPVAIRHATPSDAVSIASIYDHHARTGTATFDLEGPHASAWALKIADIVDRGWPFLVAEEGGGQVVGYAYATQFRDRPAYRHACESSVYVAAASTGRGVGTRLIEALKKEAIAASFDQMIAVVGGAEPASIALHSKCGFEERGRMRSVGFKFGRRLDTVYMQCALKGSGAD